MAQSWKDGLQTKPKLRTYIKFKDEHETENYVKHSRNRLERSLLAQLRSGTLSLNIEKAVLEISILKIEYVCYAIEM